MFEPTPGRDLANNTQNSKSAFPLKKLSAILGTSAYLHVVISSI